MSENPGETSRSKGGAAAGERPVPNGDGPVDRVTRDRLVHWIPRKLGALAAEVSTPSDLCISSDVLEELRRQTASSPERGTAGILVGRRGHHGGTTRPFVLVESCRGCEPTGTSRDQEQAFHDGILAVRDEVERTEGPGDVVGWYHSHSLLGVFLSEQDTRFHKEHFPESWQCALILVSDRERPAGGVFQQTEGLGLRRSIYVPFYEVVTEDAVLPDGRRRSRLDWRNYVSEMPVIRPDPEEVPPREVGAEPEAGPLAAGAAADPETGRRSGPSSPPDGPEAGASGVRGAAPPPPVFPRGSDAAPRRAADLPADIPVVIPRDETEGLLAPHRRKIVTAGVVVALALGGWWVWGQVVEDGPSMERAATVPAARDADAVRTGPPVATEARENEGAARPETTATPPARLAGTPDVPAASETATAGAGAAPAPGERGTAEAGTGERGEAAAEEREAAAEAGGPGGAAGGVATAFEQALRSFDASVAVYGRRRQAFASGNVDCAALAAAYRRVDEAFLTLSARYARPGTPDVAGDRYEAATSRAEGVDRHFDASGCPRPQ